MTVKRIMSTPSKDTKSIQRMFDVISPRYDLLNHLFTANKDRKWRREAVKYLENQLSSVRPPGEHARSETARCKYFILDLAAGTGDFAKEFLRLNPQCIYSVDISFEMLKINKGKVDSPNHVLVQANAEKLPFDDGFFDITGVAFGVRNFEHLENCIREVRRVLKPKGRFVTIEMFGDFQQNGLFGWYFKKVIPKLGNLISKSKYAYNYLFDSVNSFMGVEEYADLLSRNGFRIDGVVNNFRGIVYTLFAVKN
jgi:demethylmenaquinone methyltransferase/2-methoxy-6-polyprenyl-1,4-benzoquinol methylase